MENSITKLKITLEELKSNFDKETRLFQSFVLIHDYIHEVKNSKHLKALIKEFKNSSEKFAIDIKNLAKEFDKMTEKDKTKLFFRQFSGPVAWNAYLTLQFSYDIIEVLKKSKKEMRKWLDEINELLESGEDPDISYNQFKKYTGIFLDILHEKVITELDLLAVMIQKDKDRKSHPHFNSLNSILFIHDEKIKIKRQNRNTDEHRILDYIFNGKPKEDNEFFYSEMAEEFGDSEYHSQDNSWRKYRDACERINEKVMKGTTKKISDFLIIGNSKDGIVKINPDYL